MRVLTGVVNKLLEKEEGKQLWEQAYKEFKDKPFVDYNKVSSDGETIKDDGIAEEKLIMARVEAAAAKKVTKKAAKKKDYKMKINNDDKGVEDQEDLQQNDDSVTVGLKKA